MSKTEKRPESHPKSTTNFLVNSLSCALFFVLVYFFDGVGEKGVEPLELYAILLAIVLPIALQDIITSKTGLHKNYTPSFKPVRPLDTKRFAIKMIGLGVTFLFVYFLYWLLPVYQERFFQQFWLHIREVLPFLIALSIPYFIYMDMVLPNPKDAYYHLGKLALFKSKDVDNRYIWEHLKAWIVKAFFLPLMFIYMLKNINFLVTFDFSNITNFMTLYDFLYNFIFTMDVMFAAVGYIFTFKIFNSQIYSTEPTVLGWVVCLMGYSPFWTDLFYKNYFAYEDGLYWGHVFGSHPIFYIFWGSLIIACITIYSLATVAFGYRFSNLTYRGIITNGPYALTKHPAYVFKNISWWLVSVPFISNVSIEHSLRMCIMLFGVNVIYFLRARTEENHLSNYPEYVEYAEYMNQHGIFKWLGDLIPFFRYSKERADRANSKVYKPFTGRLSDDTEN